MFTADTGVIMQYHHANPAALVPAGQQIPIEIRQSYFGAIFEGNIETVKKHLEKYPQLLFAKNSNGVTGLQLAQFSAHKNIESLLIQLLSARCHIYEVGAGDAEKSVRLMNLMREKELDKDVRYTVTELSKEYLQDTASRANENYLTLGIYHDTYSVNVMAKFKVDATKLDHDVAEPFDKADMIFWQAPHSGIYGDEQLSPELDEVNKKGRAFFITTPISHGHDSLDNSTATNMGLLVGFLETAHQKVARYKSEDGNYSSGKLAIIILNTRPFNLNSKGMINDELIMPILVATQSNWRVVDRQNIEKYVINKTKGHGKHDSRTGALLLIFEESPEYLRQLHSSCFIDKSSQQLADIRRDTTAVVRLLTSPQVAALQPPMREAATVSLLPANVVSKPAVPDQVLQVGSNPGLSRSALATEQGRVLVQGPRDLSSSALAPHSESEHHSVAPKKRHNTQDETPSQSQQVAATALSPAAVSSARIPEPDSQSAATIVPTPGPIRASVIISDRKRAKSGDDVPVGQGNQGPGATGGSGSGESGLNRRK